MSGINKTYPLDLPPARGHFPGNPIIPGAWLLADALATVAAELGWELDACTVKNAKFPAPARPGDTVYIEYTPGEAGALKLACGVAGTAVLSAQITCPPSLPPTTV
jgi:3-hydroxymyristoyl/3-hydroxydecanoyl-(acyl carrier protein) dehydratase